MQCIVCNGENCISSEKPKKCENLPQIFVFNKILYSPFFKFTVPNPNIFYAIFIFIHCAFSGIMAAAWVASHPANISADDSTPVFFLTSFFWCWMFCFSSLILIENCIFNSCYTPTNLYRFASWDTYFLIKYKHLNSLDYLTLMLDAFSFIKFFKKSTQKRLEISIFEIL